MIPRFTGVDVDNVAQTEADHFGNFPVCSVFLDMRDLDQMLAKFTTWKLKSAWVKTRHRARGRCIEQSPYP
jgi:hypothetical protein